ncbi:serine/threonine protein kinase [Planctomicrobium sp. SH661]|uniref:serine/threonine protein kinase n=1 Tax=Planctomicrobium sp. SH661 TaxID=3448124 RepID=UPI003F5BFE82
MEPPSQALAQQLGALGLATAADLRRCSPRARKLARGLPGTDSVWIDALVHAGKITQYQARQLEADRGDELVIGRKFVLQRPIHLDPLLSLFEAGAPGRREKFLISRMTCSPQGGEASALRMLKTIQSLATCREQFPAIPFDAILERGSLFLLASHQPGESLAKLLVRRGRFPEPVVRGIAQEVLRQLQMTETFAVHGDLRVANLWLSHRGDIGLLNWGLLDAVSPEINIHSRLPLDAYDGLAPERGDASRRATATSDVYALGCVLWHLLTGRPPYAVADPLAKWTAHRTRQIPDVRTLAPDVSESLAQLIRNMTAREVHRRPQTCSEVRQMLGGGSNWNRSRLQRFLHEFESAAPRQVTRSQSRSRVPALAGAVLLSVGLVAAAWNRDKLGWSGLSKLSAAVNVSTSTVKELSATPPMDGRPVEASGAPTQMGAVPDNLTRTASEALPFPSSSASEIPVDSGLASLPSPDAEGVVQLAGDQEYIASEVIAGESLTLRGERERPAVVHVRHSPLTLEADNIRLENVRLIVDAVDSGVGDKSPVIVRAQTLTVTHSSLDWSTGTAGVSLVKWSPPQGTASGSGRFVLHDSTITAASHFLEMEMPLGAGLLENVLIQQVASVLSLPQGPAAGLRVPFVMNACTMQECGPLVRMPTGQSLQQSGRLSLQGADSVVQMTGGAPLIEVATEQDAALWQSHVEVAAQGLIVEVGMKLAGVRGSLPNSFRELNSEELPVDGLLTGDFHFEPDPDSRGAERLILDAVPVLSSSRLPGVDASRLP